MHLWDRVSNGDHLAPLFFVSPNQINFVVSGSDSLIYVDIEQMGAPYIPKGMVIPVQSAQPGFFSLNTAGLAAASAVRIAANGTVTQVPAAACTYSGGTGFSGAAGTFSSCYVGVNSLNPAYVGPQLVVPGLSQVNLLLTPVLAGKGDQTITCDQSNQVHVTFK